MLPSPQEVEKDPNHRISRINAAASMSPLGSNPWMRRNAQTSETFHPLLMSAKPFLSEKEPSRLALWVGGANLRGYAGGF